MHALAYACLVATTLRVTDDTRARAAAIAQATGISIGEVVARALDAYERSEFWAQTRSALAEQGPDDERWDRTVRDGLERG